MSNVVGSLIGKALDCIRKMRVRRPLLDPVREDSARSGLTVKTCARCKESVRVEYFYKNKQNSDGLHSYCKECNLIRSKAYYYKFKERISRRSKKYYSKNRESILDDCKNYYYKNRKKAGENNKKYRLNNYENFLGYSKKYYSKNRESILGAVKKYAEKNSEKVKAYQKAYRERKKLEKAAQVARL